MAINTKSVVLYGVIGVLVACLIIVGMMISSVNIPSLRFPTFPPGKGTLIIMLTDAPVELECLKITIDSVSVHRVEGDAGLSLLFVGGGTSVTIDNLLLLQDVEETLCIDEILAGSYTMIKMHIINATATFKEGKQPAGWDQTVDLNVPSESVKVIINFEVKEGGTTEVLIDMEADWVAISRSKNLRPVLKATVKEGP